MLVRRVRNTWAAVGSGMVIALALARSSIWLVLVAASLCLLLGFRKSAGAARQAQAPPTADLAPILTRGWLWLVAALGMAGVALGSAVGEMREWVAHGASLSRSSPVTQGALALMFGLLGIGYLRFPQEHPRYPQSRWIGWLSLALATIISLILAIRFTLPL